MKHHFIFYTLIIAILCTIYTPTTNTNPWLDYPKNHPYLCAYAASLTAVSIISALAEKRRAQSIIQVAVIPIEGEISSTKKLVAYAKTVFASPAVKAIVIEINSPGGNAAEAQTLFEEIITLKKQYNKPVIALAESVCASGGYYIACAADTIIAQRASTIGSIGVISAGFNYSRLLEKIGIEYTVIKRGQNKTTRSPFLPVDQDNNRILQSCIDDMYEQFTHDVAEQRTNLALEDSEQWAEGKIFSGQQALNLGLVDQLGSWTQTELIIKEKLATTNTIQWLYPAAPSFFERITQKAPHIAAQTIALLGTTITTHI